MFLPLLKKETLSNMLGARYALVFCLIILISLAVTVVRTSTFTRLHRDYQTTQAGQLRTMSSLQRATSCEQLGVTVEKAPNPLSIFVAGLDNDMTRSLTISREYGPAVGPRKLVEPWFSAMPVVDMVFVIGVVCSLLAFLLLFDAVCGEKEQGTLRMMLSGPLPRDTIILAKLVSGFLVVALPVVVAWTVSLLYVNLIARVPFTPDQYARVAAIVGFSLLYVVFFLSIGIFISSRTSKSATALIYSLSFWAVFVLALPNVIPFLVKHAAPVPDQSQLAVQKKAIRDEIHRDLWPQWHRELVTANRTKDFEREVMPIMFKRQEDEQRRREEELDRHYNQLVMNQARLSETVSRISPFAAFVYAATGVTGSGMGDYVKLLDYLDWFARRVIESNDQLHEQSIRLSETRPVARRTYSAAGKKNAGPYDIAGWPQFDPPSIDIARACRAATPDLLLLAGGAILFFLLSYLSFLRYDPK